MIRSIPIVASLVAGIAGITGIAASAHAQERGRDFTKAFVWKMDGRGFLGVQVQSMTPELRVHFGAPEEEGVLVSRVEDGGPAAGAGVLVGDIITAVDGETVENASSIVSAVRSKKEGDTVRVELWRDGVAMTLPVTIAERDRRVMDLAEYRFIPHLDELPDRDVLIARPGVPLGLHLDRKSMEALEQAMQELSERFESGEWQKKLERLSELDLSSVEERMREVEKRLQELEEELAKEKR